MMHQRLGKNATWAWLGVVEQVLDDGYPVEIACADGQTRKTIEIVGHETLIDAEYPVVAWSNRKANYRFMAGEAAWILSGSDKLEDILPFNQHIAKFSDDGVRFEGAYGPKIVNQLDYVVEALVKEITSRRAVLTIWRENPPPSRDTPCTVSVQFLIRDGYLHTVVTMRSSDVWLGLVYDLFTFSMLAGVVALKLRDRGIVLKGLGNLRNYAGSRHLYENDIKKIKDTNFIKEPGGVLTDSLKFDPFTFASVEDLQAHLWAVARGDTADLKTSFLSDLPHMKVMKEESHG